MLLARDDNEILIERSNLFFRINADNKIFLSVV